MTVRLRFDVKPLSVNAAYRGRRFATKELEAFHLFVAVRAKQERRLAAPLEGPLRARVWFYFANNQPDLDNHFKPLFDAMQKARVFVNDRQIRRLEADYLVDAESPRIEVEIEEIT